MLVEDVCKLKFQSFVCNEGEYPIKPYNAKTVKQWLSEGRKPKSISSIGYFIMPYSRDDKAWAYAYVLEEDTEALSEEEIDRYKKKHPSKEEIAAKKEEAKASAKLAQREALLIDIANKVCGNIICFDVETTGFSPAKGDEILQISIVDKNYDVLLETYLKPHNKKSWPGASQTNHIFPWTVKDAPYAEDISYKVASIFDAADVIIGHNVDFDIRFVEHCMGFAIDKSKVYDTMKIFRTDFSAENTKGKSFSLEAAVKEYCPELYSSFIQGAHDSTTDTKATMAVFLKQAEKGLCCSLSNTSDNAQKQDCEMDELEV